jgi:hypothetical protein|nr:hypothetical protein [uncultured Campylobacter sp.]
MSKFCLNKSAMIAKILKNSDKGWSFEQILKDWLTISRFLA